MPARRDPLLAEFDEHLVELRKQARTGDPELRSMWRDDAKGLAVVRTLIAAGKYGEAYRKWRVLDTACREWLPERLADVLAQAAYERIERSRKKPWEVWRVLRRELLTQRIAELEKKLAEARAEHASLAS